MKKFTEKDLAYISDMFSWNENALRLSNLFLENMRNNNDDSEAIELMEEIVGMHYENLHKCLSILNGEDSTCDEEEEEEHGE